MDNYLIDRETLGKFVDQLIRQKPALGEDPEVREKAIKQLDDEIGVAVFTQLTHEQAAEFDKLAEADADKDAFKGFFESAGIDVEKVIGEAMKNFGIKFLGGENV